MKEKKKNRRDGLEYRRTFRKETFCAFSSRGARNIRDYPTTRH